MIINVDNDNDGNVNDDHVLLTMAKTPSPLLFLICPAWRSPLARILEPPADYHHDHDWINNNDDKQREPW